MTKIVLPELGEGIKKATVSYWYFKVGGKVSEKEDLVERRDLRAYPESPRCLS